MLGRVRSLQAAVEELQLLAWMLCACHDGWPPGLVQTSCQALPVPVNSIRSHLTSSAACRARKHYTLRADRDWSLGCH